MSVPTAEMIGTLRADIRRVEMTLGARIDARIAANDALLREQLQNERQQLRADIAQLRADLMQRLDECRAEMESHFDASLDLLRRDVRTMRDRLLAL